MYVRSPEGFGKGCLAPVWTGAWTRSYLEWESIEKNLSNDLVVGIDGYRINDRADLSIHLVDVWEGQEEFRPRVACQGLPVWETQFSTWRRVWGRLTCQDQQSQGSKGSKGSKGQSVKIKGFQVILTCRRQSRRWSQDDAGCHGPVAPSSHTSTIHYTMGH